MMETRLWTSPLSKRKSTLFSNHSRIIIHGHVHIKKSLSIMDGLNVHYIDHSILSYEKLFFDMNVQG